MKHKGAFNITKSKPILEDVRNAISFKQRAIGLIGQKQISYGLYFKRSNWAHTFFMKEPIDIIYLNRKMKVTRIDHKVLPWRFLTPAIKASSMLELPKGQAEKSAIEIGDELYVGN